MRIDKSKIFLAAKLVCTFTFLFLIFKNTDWNAFAATLKTVDRKLVAGAFLLMLVCVPFSAYKWQQILKIHNQKFSLNLLTRWYFIAMFFNNFLPTGIGGDGYRIWKAIDKKCPKGLSILAVLSERLSGIIILLGLGYFASIISWFVNGSSFSRSIAFVGTAGILVAFITGLFGFSLRYRINFKEFGRRIQSRLPEKLFTFLNHGSDYGRQLKLSIWSLIVLSLLFHIISTMWMLLLIQSVGGSIEVWNLVLVAAVIAVITVIPISINGIGVVDASFIWLVGKYGVPFEAALSYMLLFRFLLIPISVCGAILYLATDSGTSDPAKNTA